MKGMSLIAVVGYEVPFIGKYLTRKLSLITCTFRFNAKNKRVLTIYLYILHDC